MLAEIIFSHVPTALFLSSLLCFTENVVYQRKGGFMGYYIDFVFDPEIPITRKEVVSRLQKAGAIKLRAEHQQVTTKNKKTEEFVVNPNLSGLYTVFLYDGLCGTVTVFPRASGRFKGHWMEVRTSWGNTPDEIRSVWQAVFELAEKVDCRVYDGQIGEYIFPEDIDRMVRYFFTIARGMAGLFGTVSN
jgi:hypothetical protein